MSFPLLNEALLFLKIESFHVLIDTSLHLEEN